MRDVTFGRRRFHIYPLLSDRLTISIDAIFLVLFLLAGYALRALTEKRA